MAAIKKRKEKFCEDYTYEVKDIDYKTGEVVRTFIVKDIYIEKPKNVVVGDWFNVPDMLKTKGCDCIARRII